MKYKYVSKNEIRIHTELGTKVLKQGDIVELNDEQLKGNVNFVPIIEKQEIKKK